MLSMLVTVHLNKRKCSDCKRLKPISSFSKNSYRCKKCNTAHSSEYRKSHREKTNASARKSRSSESAKFNAWKHNLKVRYGITPDKYREMLKAQNGCCALCGIGSPGSYYKYFCIDHDHLCCPTHVSCGKCIRGLLCWQCNRRLGSYENNLLFFLEKAPAYVNKFK